MLIQIDTSKIPDKDILFIAELVVLSGKRNCTIDESIKTCKEILKEKENK
jgi:hypothetical protein